MVRKKFTVVFVVVFLYFADCFCVQKGSDVAVSVEPLAVFPAADTDNEMLSFGWFKNGFTLEDSSTTCSFNSVFPVGGSVNLNGGNLHLNSDLIFSNAADFASFGNIHGNYHVLEYDSDNDNFSDPNNVGLMYDIDLITNADIIITDTLRFEGDCSFDGKNRRVTFDAGANVIVGSNSTLHVKNARLVDVSDYQIRCVDDTSKIILDNVDFIQDETFTFTVGQMEIRNMVDVIGSCVFYLETNKTVTIGKNSTFRFSDGSKLAVGTLGNLTHDKSIWFDNHSSLINFENAALEVGTCGFNVFGGSVLFSGRVDIDVNSTDTTDLYSGLVLGNGLASGDLDVTLNPATYVSFNTGFITYNMTVPDGIKSMSGYSKLVREGTHYFHCMRDFKFSNLSIKIAAGTTLGVHDGVDVLYEDCKILLPGVKFAITGSRDNVYSMLLAGGQEVFVEEGIIPVGFLIKNPGNVIGGNGSIKSLVGGINLYDSNASLILNLDGQIASNITLNGGLIYLYRDLEFSHDSLLLGEGSVNLVDKDLIFGGKDLSWTSSIYWDGNYGSVELNSKVSLSSTWTFSGIATINGKNNILDLGQYGNIVVEKGATLRMKNLKVHNATDNRIRCLDDSSKIICDNVSWVQEGSFDFDTGKLEVVNDFDLSGSFTFNFDSTQTITINKNSAFKLSDQVTFVARTKKIGGNDIFWMEEPSSNFEINESSIIIGDGGIKLTRGRLTLIGMVDVDIHSTNTTNGIFLGDGTSEGDLDIIFKPASNFFLKNGHMVCDETDPYKIKSLSGYSKITRQNNNYLYIKKDIVFSNMTVYIEPTTYLDNDPGVLVSYEDSTLALPGVKFSGKFSRYFNNYTLLLNSDGSEVFVKEGVFPLYLVIAGTGNYLRGNGVVTGEINLSGSNSELILDLEGHVANDITLNGGKIILDHDLQLSYDNKFLTSGTVELGQESLIFGSKDISWTSSIYWDGSLTDAGALEFSSMVELSSTWTFSGSCIIKGNNNVLLMNPTGKIFVEKGSKLTFQNLRIKSLSGTNIQCVDDTGQIVFDDVKTMLGGDYSFEKGSFSINYLFDVKGSSTFYYRSSKSSSIKPCTTFAFWPGTAFSYDPPIADRQLIVMEDCDGSILSFDEATLHSTATGLQLTKGILRINGNCHLVSEATIESEGIRIGNSCEEDNLRVEVMSVSTLELDSGYFVYDNQE